MINLQTLIFHFIKKIKGALVTLPINAKLYP